MSYRRASNCLKTTLKFFVSLIKEPDEERRLFLFSMEGIAPTLSTHRTQAEGALAGGSGLEWNFPWALRAIWFSFPIWLQRLLELYPICLVSQYSDSHFHILTSVKLSFFTPAHILFLSFKHTHTHQVVFMITL